MIKNLIFDCGGVLVDFDPLKMMKTIGVPPKDTKRFYDAFFGNWDEMDAGTINELDYFENVYNLLPSRLYPYVEKLIETRDELSNLYPNVPKLLNKYKLEGYDLYILSNAPISFGKHIRSLPEMKYFKDTIFSADIKMVKPHQDIFEYAIKTFKISPQESLFIDDRSDNVKMALSCGFQGLVFKGDYQTIDDYLKNYHG